MKKKFIIFIMFILCIIIILYSSKKLINFEKNLYTVITTDDLMEKINKDESFTIFFLQKNCMACKEVETVINEYIKETNEIIYAIDLTDAKKKSYLISIINISETPTVIRYARGEEEKRLTSIFTKEEFVIFQNN